MRTNVIREKLYDYIRFAEKKEVKAIYTMVEEEIATKDNPWDDAQFMAGLDRTVEEYERGEVTASIW
ncbi:hypothetical protein [Sphingobacterium pedocola]|uniref:Uncharacterized protein n=1 Tax=Sphingobacterium pedocola TaxID=2082722 RepID=A0ABR9T2Q5_9SPHI|nr:hypothetical protein [Sphingobacterium pedocola]MBE8719626.1 hypothetical protein [Sphingobacterium pedocola]